MKKMFEGSLTVLLALFCVSAFAAQNYVHDTESVAYLNPGAAISSGELVDLGDRYGVALVDIASNATGTVQINGVWSLARGNTNLIAAGAALYYSSATAVDGTATADEYVGQCTEAVTACLDLTNSLGEADVFVKVDLNVPQRQCIVGTDVQAYDADLDTWATVTPSANGQALVVTNYAAMKALLDLEIGTDVEAWDADLDTWATVTPSANGQSLVAAADYAAMKVLLDLEIGTDVEAWDADLDTYAGITPSATAQLALEHGNNSVVLCKRQRVLVADINAGVSVLPAISGKSYRVVNVTAIAYGGAVGTVTTVDVLGTQSAGEVKLCAYAQASLTQSAVLQMGDAGAAVTADGASYAACDAATAITVGKTGGDADTATGVDFIITYVIE